MKCTVYRSNKKEMTYLYLPVEHEDFSKVPAELMKMVEPLEQVLEFDLTPERKLASEDPKEVLKQLESQGWYLQISDDLYRHNAS